MALPSVSSENLSSAVSDASPITMRWERGPVSGSSRVAPGPWCPPSLPGSHLGHGHRVLPRLERSAVAQGEHAAQRPPCLRGLVKCLPCRPGVQAGLARGLRAGTRPKAPVLPHQNRAPLPRFRAGSPAQTWVGPTPLLIPRDRSLLSRPSIESSMKVL